MTNEETKEFFQWLDNASLKERDRVHDKLFRDSRIVTDYWLKLDIYYRLRHIELEYLTDIQLSNGSVYEKYGQSLVLLSRCKEKQAIDKIKGYIKYLEDILNKGE